MKYSFFSHDCLSCAVLFFFFVKIVFTIL
jgi:hypothetical protein